MPDSILSQIERRLIASRLPLARRKRALQELSEHREDLIRAALNEGLSENDAAIRADNSLGDPGELVDQIVMAARRASWAGRHPVTAFCVLPFFGMILAFLLAYGLVLGAFFLFVPTLRFSGFNCGALGSVMANYATQITFCEHLTQLIVVAAAAFIFCKLAVQSTSRRHWLWIACAICSVQGYLWMMTVTGHNITIGYLLGSNHFVPVTSAIIPVVIALLIELHHSRQLRTRLAFTAAIAVMPLIGSGCATQKSSKSKESPHTRAWIGGEYNVIKLPSHGRATSVSDGNPPTNSPKTRAVHVFALSTNSPAYAAGLRKHDFVAELNGQKLKTLRQFRKTLNALPAESSVQLKVIRDNKLLDLTIHSGTEKYYHNGTFALKLPGYVEDWDLWPNPGFSLVFVGYEPDYKVRRNLNSKKELMAENWRAWCVIFEASSSDQIVSQEKRAD